MLQYQYPQVSSYSAMGSAGHSPAQSISSVSSDSITTSDVISNPNSPSDSSVSNCENNSNLSNVNYGFHQMNLASRWAKYFLFEATKIFNFIFTIQIGYRSSSVIPPTISSSVKLLCQRMVPRAHSSSTRRQSPRISLSLTKVGANQRAKWIRKIHSAKSREMHVSELR